MRLQILSFTLSSLILVGGAFGQSLHFNFDQDLNDDNNQFRDAEFFFEEGIAGKALAIGSGKGYYQLQLENAETDGSKDFSIQGWIKTSSKNPTVFLSQKTFENKGIAAQKNPGWALYSSGGTFAWTVGSGDRRVNYERSNGDKMPVSDGKWHQITLTYNKELAEFRLFYDGENKAIYKVNFDFTNSEPLTIGVNKQPRKENYSAAILNGQSMLQLFVDAFKELGLAPLENHELIDLIVDPHEVLQKKNIKKPSIGENDDRFLRMLEIRDELVSNQYTVYQNRALTELKPVSKIYRLIDGKITLNDSVAASFSKREELHTTDFALDNLSIWDRTLSPAEIADSYSSYKEIDHLELSDGLKSIVIGVWNIWHGGIHWSPEKDGWDSRLRIVEMIREKEIDVLLMQETYSSGDFIAAELGYYFATTSDWDYRYQGSNISVLSRYPIEEIQVLPETEFNNVAVRLKASETQQFWAISNWYGMSRFSTVFDFHQDRFNNSDNIPVFFGGDFNAVPHTDGGESEASENLLNAGFTDAYRSLFPDVEKNPGFTHREGVRIDQLYFKGKGLQNSNTEVVSDWPTGFPSDHYLIVSRFDLGN